jgi:hypothetical protein
MGTFMLYLIVISLLVMIYLLWMIRSHIHRIEYYLEKVVNSSPDK